MAGLSRRQRIAVGAGGGAPCRRRVAPAAVGQLDANFHGQRGAIRRAVFSDLSSRRRVRQAHGGQRLGFGDRRFHDGETGPAPGGAGGRAGGRIRHLWRRQPVRRFFRAGADGARIVSGRGYSKTPDAGGARARHLDLHHVGAARNAGDPERDPDAVFRHHAVRGAGPRRDRVGDHARLRTVVAPPRRGRRPPRRRGLWRGRRRQHRCGTKRGSRRAHSRARHGSPGIRSRRDRARTHKSIDSTHRARRVAADRGGGRQSGNVDIRAAASRRFVSGRGTLGAHLAPRRGRGVVGRGRACCRDRDARCRQLSAPSHLARKPGRRRKRFRAAGRQRCKLGRLRCSGCGTAGLRHRARMGLVDRGRPPSSRLQYQRTCSPP